MKRTQLRAVAVLAVLGFAAVACGQPLTTAHKTPTAVDMQTATPVTTAMGSAVWAIAQGASVSEMLKTYPIVFVGHVESVAVRQVPILPANMDFAGQATVEGKTPMSAPGPTVPFSNYSVTVVTPIRGDLSAGDTVTVLVEGGDVAQPDGQLRRWVVEGDRLLEVGQTYLLLTTRRRNVLESAPWGRFKITDDKIEPLSDEWAGLGVVKELSGKLRPAAIQQLESGN